MPQAVDGGSTHHPQRPSKEESWETFQRRSVVCGTTVQLGAEFDHLLRDYLTSFQWESLANPPNVHHPQMVREFYWNMSFAYDDDDDPEDQKRPKIRSTVWFRPIEFDCVQLGEWLGLPSDGERIFFDKSTEKDYVESFTPDYYGAFLLENATPAGEISSKSIKPKLMLLNHFLSHTILAKGGHLDTVSGYNGFLLHCFATNRRLCAPYIMMMMMINASNRAKRRVLPYGNFLTIIFEKSSVSLDDQWHEQCRRRITPDTIRNLKLCPTTTDDKESDAQQQQQHDRVRDAEEDVVSRDVDDNMESNLPAAEQNEGRQQVQYPSNNLHLLSTIVANQTAMMIELTALRQEQTLLRQQMGLMLDQNQQMYQQFRQMCQQQQQQQQQAMQQSHKRKRRSTNRQLQLLS